MSVRRKVVLIFALPLGFCLSGSPGRAESGPTAVPSQEPTPVKVETPHPAPTERAPASRPGDTTTYQSTGGVAQTRSKVEEVILDGKDIPSTIDFRGEGRGAPAQGVRREPSEKKP